MVACYRKLNGWTHDAIITEYVVANKSLVSTRNNQLTSRRYRTFAGDKFRPLDEAFIASFNAEVAQLILDGVDIPYVPLQTSPVQKSLGSPPPFPWSNYVGSSRLANVDSGDSLPTPPPSDKSERDYDDDTWPAPGCPSPDPW